MSGVTYNPWAWPKIERLPTGTRVWRAYFHDRSSLTFGIWVGHEADEAKAHAAQWGDVFAVEAVT